MARKKPPNPLQEFYRNLPTEALEFFRKAGAKGGKLGGSLGGKKSAANLTAEQRRQRAKKASMAAAKMRKAKSKTKK
jgi:hypothetical protein